MATGDWREEYRAQRDMGVSHQNALYAAFSSKTYDDFLHQVENGPGFDDEAARIAAVHTRLDVALLNFHATIQTKLLQAQLRWIKFACGAVIAAAIINVFV